MVYESRASMEKISLPNHFWDVIEDLSEELDLQRSRIIQLALVQYFKDGDILGETFEKINNRIEALLSQLETEAEEVKPSIGDFLPLIEGYEEWEKVTCSTVIPKKWKHKFERVREKFGLGQSEANSLLLGIAFKRTKDDLFEEEETRSEEEEKEEEENGKEV